MISWITKGSLAQVEVGWTEALLVFDRREKCFDHLRIAEISIELIQLVEPELKPIF